MVRFILAALFSLLALPALSQSIKINEAYARINPHAKTGAVFMEVMNLAGGKDRLIGVRSDVAAIAELHTHIETDEGVMQMREVEDGFPLPPEGMHVLKRGGDHVMLMGLSPDLSDGDEIVLVLVFQEAGEMELRVTIDNARKPGQHGSGGDH